MSCDLVSWILTRAVAIMFKTMVHQKKMRRQKMRNMRKMTEVILWGNRPFKTLLKNWWSLGEAVFIEDPADTRARGALLRKSHLKKRKKRRWRLVLKLPVGILVIIYKHSHKTHHFNCFGIAQRGCHATLSLVLWEAVLSRLSICPWKTRVVTSYQNLCFNTIDLTKWVGKHFVLLVCHTSQN